MEEDKGIIIQLRKLFKSLILDKYNANGEIKVINFLNDEYYDVNSDDEFPTVGGIEVIFDLDSKRLYSHLTETYDKEYSDLFIIGLHYDKFDSILKYLPELPFYHEIYHNHINLDALIDTFPEMIDNINSKSTSKLESIELLDREHLSKLRGTNFSLKLHAESGLEDLHYIASGTYPDLLWVIS